MCSSDLAQDSVEPGVVPHGELHRVAVLGLVVRRVTVKDHALSVVLLDQGLEVLVLDRKSVV